MSLLRFCIVASAALWCRDQLWPLSVSARLVEKIMDPWVWCTHFQTVVIVCSRRTLCSPEKVGIKLEFRQRGVVCLHVLHFPHPPAPPCSCVYLRASWKMSFVGPDPNRRGFYILRGRVRGEWENPRCEEFNRWHYRNEIHVCSTRPGDCAGSWVVAGVSVIWSAMRRLHSSLSIIQPLWILMWPHKVSLYSSKQIQRPSESTTTLVCLYPCSFIYLFLCWLWCTDQSTWPWNVFIFSSVNPFPSKGLSEHSQGHLRMKTVPFL